VASAKLSRASVATRADTAAEEAPAECPRPTLEVAAAPLVVVAGELTAPPLAAAAVCVALRFACPFPRAGCAGLLCRAVRREKSSSLSMSPDFSCCSKPLIVSRSAAISQERFAPNVSNLKILNF
jgi:hypothetical protein